MTLEYLEDRLQCIKALGGCGAACDRLDDDEQNTDWVCPMCQKEWNTYDAQNDLDRLEEADHDNRR